MSKLIAPRVIGSLAIGFLAGALISDVFISIATASLAFIVFNLFVNITESLGE